MRLMTGRVIEEVFPDDRAPRRRRDLARGGGSHQPARAMCVDVSLEALRAGEVVGLAGLVGSGKSEVARACFGANPVAEGKVFFRWRGRHGPVGRVAMLDRGVIYNAARPPRGRLDDDAVLPREHLAAQHWPAALRPAARCWTRRAERQVGQCLGGAAQSLSPPRI